jgi:hypothetical protein
MTDNAMKQPEKRKLSKTKLFIFIGIILFIAILFDCYNAKSKITKKEKEINETISEIEEVDGSFADDDDNEFQDIKDDFQKYWESSPIYLCDLAWNPNEYIKNNWEKRIDRWKEASQESEHAAFLLAECSWLKFNIDDFIEAKYLYLFALKKELPEARIRLSEIWFWGFHTPQSKLIAMRTVRPLTTTKYASMIHTIFDEQKLVSTACAMIYKMFLELYREGVTQRGVEIGILICRQDLCDNIDKSALQEDESQEDKSLLVLQKIEELLIRIEKPKKIDKLTNGRTACTWQVIKCPFVKGFTIYFDKNGESYDIDVHSLE